jgi:hypothetical protein
MRSGTLNVTGIVGFGKAAELAKAEMAAESQRLRGLRDRLNDRLHKGLDEIFINGSVEHRLPHSLNISFAYVEGESLLMGINDVAVSSGSACTSASLEPSYVLKALGAGDDLAHSVDPLRTRTLEHRRGSRLRRRQADYRGHTPSRDVTALRAGQGRRGSLDDAVGNTLIAECRLPIADWKCPTARWRGSSD